MPKESQTTAATISAEPVILDKELVRKREMNEMRKKYGIRRDGLLEEGEGSKPYKDRAGARRLHKGSDNPYEKTEVSDVNSSIRSSNKGFKMLSKMGWNEGGGLGKDQQGRVEPVRADVRTERAGLGSEVAFVGSAAGGDLDPRQKQKAEIRKKTQERFDSIPREGLD